MSVTACTCRNYWCQEGEIMPVCAAVIWYWEWETMPGRATVVRYMEGETMAIHIAVVWHMEGEAMPVHIEVIWCTEGEAMPVRPAVAWSAEGEAMLVRPAVVRSAEGESMMVRAAVIWSPEYERFLLPMGKRDRSPTMYAHERRRAKAHNLTVNTSRNGQQRVTFSSSTVDVLPPAPPVPVYEPPSAPVQDDQTDFWNTNGAIPYNPDEINTMGIKLSTKAKRYQNSDAPLRTWLNFRNDQLDERMRFEGRGNKMHDDTCPGCHGMNIGTYRCEDCFGRELLCRGCCVARHATMPFHRIKVWKDTFFQPAALRDLGLIVQLGEDHAPGTICLFGLDLNKDFIVLHTNGLHSVRVRSCGCTPPNAAAIDVYKQLLRAGLYPATPYEPKTCGTFALMRLAHGLSLQGKVSAYHFYKSLHYYTDNTGTVKLPDRYRAFTLMLRKWRHETMVKRGGRAYDPRPDRVEATGPGELAVLCRACPVPGMNLPDNWQDEPPESAFIYWLSLAKDACFRFKNRLRSSEAKDPTLGAGMAYFVDHGPYLEHCKNHASEEEISTCSGFAAIHLANLKGMKGHRTSGVGGVCCSRQQCWRPNGIGDLQKGERYCNMDYIFWSSLVASRSVTTGTPSVVAYDTSATPPNPDVASNVVGTLNSAFIIGYFLTVLTSYDIVCQWLKNLFQRIPRLPEHLQLPIRREQLIGKIPKFHFDAHGKKDHAQFSFNFTRGAGESEGEGIERNWSYMKAGAGQTIEMGPGGRHDVLDDFFGYSNYRKMADIGNSLLKKLLKAIPEAISHRRAFEELDAHLKQDKPEQVAEWEEEYAAWDKKPKGSPCIFDTDDSATSMAEIKLQLANEEAAKSGLTTAAHTQSSFLLMAMDIEDMQRKLTYDVKEFKTPTVLQKAQFQERRVALRKRINAFRKQQTEYMPGLRHVLRDPTVLDDNLDILTERIKLYLPSELSAGSHRDRACTTGLAGVEERLREAAARDGLSQLRRSLRTRTYLNKWRVKNLSGQRMSTRARSLQHRVDIKVHEGKSRYRHARLALLALRGPGTWTNVLKELKDDDVRALNERALTEREKAQREHRIKTGKPLEDDVYEAVVVDGTSGESRRKLSWIWMSQAEDEDSPSMVEALRVEWAKCKARQARWHEELMLLQEEMRRVIAFGKSKERWWRERPFQRTDVDPELAEGLASYALELAEQERAFYEMLQKKWATTRSRVEAVLKDLAKPGFPETIPEEAVPIDIDMEENGDVDGEETHGLIDEWNEDSEAEVEMIA
ncbi:hypothetical protein HWV62_20507 [Athelia sp. TMB]|nr:hypothetical protein HWV62_20507 [Athelia sp. TMB]